MDRCWFMDGCNLPEGSDGHFADPLLKEPGFRNHRPLEGRWRGKEMVTESAGFSQACTTFTVLQRCEGTWGFVYGWGCGGRPQRRGRWSAADGSYSSTRSRWHQTNWERQDSWLNFELWLRKHLVIMTFLEHVSQRLWCSAVSNQQRETDAL